MYEKVFSMPTGKVLSALKNKMLRKNLPEDIFYKAIMWFTGYKNDDVAAFLNKDTPYKSFFEEAPQLNPNRVNIKGSICGVKIDEIDDPVYKEIRRLDKLIDDLCKGKKAILE